MSDYIDRLDAIIAVNGVLVNHIPTLLPQYEDIPLKCGQAIMKIPSAEVEPVKHCRNISEKGFLCSTCSFGDFGGFHGYEPTYCPNCGAKVERSTYE